MFEQRLPRLIDGAYRKAYLGFMVHVATQVERGHSYRDAAWSRPSWLSFGTKVAVADGNGDGMQYADRLKTYL